jgi:DNA-binding CsgD family transcriptional regulator
MMRKALYLITRDGYLSYGLRKSFSEMQTGSFHLETLQPQDYHLVNSASHEYDVLYIMADEEVLRCINFHYPQLSFVLVPSTCRPEELLRMMKHSGDSQSHIERSYRYHKRHYDTLFTRREEEVLALMRRGMTPCEIAQTIKRSVKTVSHYKRLIMEKTGCKSDVHLLRLLHNQMAG